MQLYSFFCRNMLYELSECGEVLSEAPVTQNHLAAVPRYSLI